MKIKRCSECSYEGSLWKANPPLCQSCARKTYKPIVTKYVFTDMGEFNLKIAKSKANEELIKSRKAISPISKNMASKLDKYRKLRDQFFIDNPVCQFPLCKSTVLPCIMLRVEQETY